MKACKHPRSSQRNVWRNTGPGRLCMHRVCMRCGEWLPLGRSDESDERVAIEIRAAVLAAAWKPIGGVRRFIEPDEARGWNGWPYRQPENEGEHTGFLAAQIRNHERDLGDVNWAGHHMADHPIADVIARSSQRFRRSRR